MSSSSPSAFKYVTVSSGSSSMSSSCIITIKREPVNSMNALLWSEIRQALESVEHLASSSSSGGANAIKSVVFASGLSRDVFTAGNDLNELYAPATSESRFNHFWSEQTSCLLAILMSPLCTVAAVKGACPAGGCILSLCCDYVVATSNATMGLNEVALGIAVPRYWALLLAQTVGHRRAEHYCNTAALVPASQAQADGIIAKIVPDSEQLIPAAVALAEKNGKYANTPGYMATKGALRETLATDWARYAAREEPETAWAGMCEPERVKAMGALMARMTKKAKSSAPSSRL